MYACVDSRRDLDVCKRRMAGLQQQGQGCCGQLYVTSTLELQCALRPDLKDQVKCAAPGIYKPVIYQTGCQLHKL